jgi:hypothetical protein
MIHRTGALPALATALLLWAAGPLPAQSASPVAPDYQEMSVTTRATGSFDVKLAPLAAYDTTAGSTLSRMSVDKQLHGDLEGTSKGEMLIAATGTKNSAGYVAVERVTGTLKGRKGTFILQHSATMNRGVPNLVITVVPDSGTDDLAGLSGTMNIIITDGKHSYEFDYSLPRAE